MPTCLFMPSATLFSALPTCATLAITATLDIDSKILLKKTIGLIATKGYKLGNIDATICAERPKMNPHIPAMKKCLADVIGCDEDDISIKATTTEKLGFTGREEGISAYATVLIEKSQSD